MTRSQMMAQSSSNLILGIDEVGRGPWAGPLVLGACILPARFDGNNRPLPEQAWQDNLTDSKKLTAKKRELLSEEIYQKAIATGLGWVFANELDKIGLSNALKTAAFRAVENLSANDSDEPVDFFSEIIIDGTQNFLKGTEYEDKVTVLKKADFLIKEVSAASIIAKVARDNYMIKLAEKYPDYGFEKHVGYGTKVHKEALEKFGPCPEHRFSFRPVAKIASPAKNANPAKIANSANPANSTRAANFAKTANPTRFVPKKNTTTSGKYAEEVVIKHLQALGHKIIAHNYKTKTYEIDIISATKEHIYFTEVKYRKNISHGEPLETITIEKQKQMHYATECFMKFLSKKLGREDLPAPLLAVASVSKDYELETWFPLAE